MRPPPLNYDSPQALRAYLDSRGLGMRKKFGQNFLVNRQARERLVDALEIGAGDAVWEVGPGLGAMTSLLLERGARVSAFEIDGGFCAALKEIFGDDPRFSLIEGDALKTWRQNPPGDYFLGNLPYTIAAALVGSLVEKDRLFKRMVVTVQREVALRMIAKPGSKDYSSFSVLCSSAYTVTPLHVLKGALFYPVPHVDSQGVRLDLRTDIDPRAYPSLLRPLVRHLFSSRRKTIRNNLLTFLAPRIPAGKTAPEIAVEALRSCNIPENERAENLGVEEFAALARAVEVS